MKKEVKANAVDWNLTISEVMPEQPCREYIFLNPFMGKGYRNIIKIELQV